MPSLNDNQIPYLNLSDKVATRKILQGYGGTDMTDVVVRNLERIHIQKEAALMSVASEVLLFQKINGLHTLINQAPAGGVKVQFPVDQANLGNSESDNLPDMKALYLNLDRANTTYTILHEATFEGGAMAENDSILEATEQLAAKIDKQVITDLQAKKFAGNNVAASNTWITSGSPYDDIKNATNKIIQNSAINVLTIRGNTKFFSCIVPIEAREAMQKREVVDGVKTTLAGQIEAGLNTQIVYTRPPFTGEGDVWPLTTSALVIPTMDRKVGRLYTFDGGNIMPSMFQTLTENGKRVSQNSWWKVGVTPNEKTALTTDNRRISEITAILP